MAELYKWEDATTYSRGERGNIEPTAWKIMGKRLSIYITCNHSYYPGEWIMHCFSLGLKEIELGAKDLKQAKELAIFMCLEVVGIFSTDLNKIKEVTDA